MEEFPQNRSTAPDVSVVICAYNEAMYLPNTLRSLQKVIGNTRHSVEVLGVNNNSTDETPDIFRHHKVPTVHESEQGLSYARQTGLEAAKGDIVLMTDADTIAHPPSWINNHVAHYRDPEVVETAGSCEFAGAHPFHLWLRKKNIATKLSTILRTPDRTTDKEKPPVGLGTNLSYKRQSALKVGYEPGSDMGEDALMWYKLQSMGKAVADYSPDIAVSTSGRRFSSIPRVLEHCASALQRKILATITGQLHPSHLQFTNKR